MTDNEKETPIQAYSKWTLCQLYGVGYKQFNTWIKPFSDKIGPQRGKRYTPEQVKIIFECVGAP